MKLSVERLTDGRTQIAIAPGERVLLQPEERIGVRLTFEQLIRLFTGAGYAIIDMELLRESLRQLPYPSLADERAVPPPLPRPGIARMDRVSVPGVNPFTTDVDLPRRIDRVIAQRDGGDETPEPEGDTVSFTYNQIRTGVPVIGESTPLDVQALAERLRQYQDEGGPVNEIVEP